MFEPHEGTLQLKHKFQQAYNWLEKSGPSELKTQRGTNFVVQAEITQKGPHTGEKVIRFMQDDKSMPEHMIVAGAIIIIVIEPVLICIVQLLMALFCEISLWITVKIISLSNDKRF